MRTTYALAVVFIITLNIAACSKNEALPPPASRNIPPSAEAGSHQSFSMPVDGIELKGQGTDVDGYVTSFKWRKAQGPEGIQINMPNTAATTIDISEYGLYSLELTVIDDDGAIGKDTINLLVGPVGDPCYGCWDY